MGSLDEDDIIIRRCSESDAEAVWEIINDAAQAYKGVIPDDRWHEPYMSRAELGQELQDGVVFWGAADGRDCRIRGNVLGTADLFCLCEEHSDAAIQNSLNYKNSGLLHFVRNDKIWR